MQLDVGPIRGLHGGWRLRFCTVVGQGVGRVRPRFACVVAAFRRFTTPVDACVVAALWCTHYRYALLFPACDVASAYPLGAITLGNNLMSAWATGRTPMVERYRHFRLAFRLVAAVPPLAGAFFVSNLDTILSFAGILGFFIAFFVPAALYVGSVCGCVGVWAGILHTVLDGFGRHYYSRKRCLEVFPNTSARTMYEHVVECKPLLPAIVLIMAGLMAYVFEGVVAAAINGTQV